MNGQSRGTCVCASCSTAATPPEAAVATSAATLLNLLSALTLDTATSASDGAPLPSSPCLPAGAIPLLFSLFFAPPTHTHTLSLTRCHQDGVNWLNFLRQCKLHGALCDDMGLGKTLQVLCVVLADVVDATITAAAAAALVPSLIVCPATVVTHWQQEIIKLFSKPTPDTNSSSSSSSSNATVSGIATLIYMGPLAARTLQRQHFSRSHVVITS